MNEPSLAADLDLASYDFELPADRIAQYAVEPRHAARLLVNTPGAEPRDATMWDLPEVMLARYGRPPLLVVNDTRVVPARLLARKQTGGKVEFLLEHPFGPDGNGLTGHSTLYKSSKPLRAGQQLVLEGGGGVEVVAVLGEGRARIDLHGAATLGELLDRCGHVPLPPYIRGGVDQPELDRPRYQCAWAHQPGAVAAPTAGLHFSPQLLARLAAAGIERTAVTLHVGPGTFLPVRSDDLRGHRVAAERYELSAQTAAALAQARAEGRPVVAVGTTVTRALEHAAAQSSDGRPAAGQGWADLTILPGHHFAVVQGLLTNFHLPRSSLLVLLAAFWGRTRVLAAYQAAVARGYRFYSYGDAGFFG